MESEKAEDVAAIMRVRVWAAQKSIPELNSMAKQTLERMKAAGLVQDELGGEVVQGELIDA